MRWRFYRFVAFAAERLSDGLRRLHRWAVDAQAAENLRQLNLNFGRGKGSRA